MNTLPHDDQPDVALATWLSEVGRRRAPAAQPPVEAQATLPPAAADHPAARRLVLLSVLLLSALQYVYAATMLTIVSLPALVFFGIR